ncbi:hypothetical protein B9K06_19655 [Bacillus sp. OG2]|nr:hypothetical protein B9K06_19655 [Bacillus sp. OG2]
MSQIKVTVGIPVYNSANHISICLDSILNQSMEQESIEIIMVNDGSTDSSGQVLDSYASSHPNITVIQSGEYRRAGRPAQYNYETSPGRVYLFRGCG